LFGLQLDGVDGNVDPAGRERMGQNVLYGARDGSGVYGVYLNRMSCTTVPIDALRYSLQLGQCEAEQKNRCAVRGERVRNGGSDVTAGTKDDRYFALQ
jgi:hypothetical protein